MPLKVLETIPAMLGNAQTKTKNQILKIQSYEVMTVTFSLMPGFPIPNIEEFLH